MKMISVILILCLTLQSAFGLVIVLKNNKVITGPLICSKKNFIYIDTGDKYFQIQKGIVKKIYDNDQDVTSAIMLRNDTTSINLQNKDIEVLVVENTLDSLKNISDREFQLKLLKEQQNGQQKLMDKATSPIKTYLLVSLLIGVASYLIVAGSTKK